MNFNIALFPQEGVLLSQCIDFAQANLKKQADGYLLGPSAYPHVTLCQFKTKPARIKEIWSAVEGLQLEPMLVGFTHVFLWKGKEKHLGKHWVGLAVQKDQALIELQRKVYETLDKLGAEPGNLPADYVPHLTFARCSSPVKDFSELPPAFWHKPYPMGLSLGRSDENGVYSERLFSSRGLTNAMPELDDD